jgi:hypothetical protein
VWLGFRETPCFKAPETSPVGSPKKNRQGALQTMEGKGFLAEPIPTLRNLRSAPISNPLTALRLYRKWNFQAASLRSLRSLWFKKPRKRRSLRTSGGRALVPLHRKELKEHKDSGSSREGAGGRGKPFENYGTPRVWASECAGMPLELRFSGLLPHPPPFQNAEALVSATHSPRPLKISCFLTHGSGPLAGKESRDPRRIHAADRMHASSALVAQK